MRVISDNEILGPVVFMSGQYISSLMCLTTSYTGNPLPDPSEDGSLILVTGQAQICLDRGEQSLRTSTMLPTSYIHSYKVQ